MSFHNETCGCAECGNYGQAYNPGAIHNQSCGCAKCGNYSSTVQSVPVQAAPSVTGSPSKKRKRSGVRRAAKQPAPGVEMVAVPVELLDEVRAMIARRGSA
jgi:hypothetical protein